MRHSILLLILAGSAACPLRAQQVEGRELTVLLLGGDSAQVALVSLVAGEAYRLEIRPAGAQIQVRRRATPPESPLPLIERASTDSNRVVGLISRARGEYLVELTNPGRPARIRVVHEGTTVHASEGASRAMFEPELRIFDETFPGPRSSVMLVAGVVYRVEIRSAGPIDGGNIRFRSVNTVSPPLFLQPMSDPLQGTGGVSFLLIPNTTDEFHVVISQSTQIRMAIIRDPRETARWASMSDATRNLPRAGIALRAVAIGRFPRPPKDASEIGEFMEAGTGVDVCLGAVPRGAWMGGAVGGCALSFAYYQRPNNAATFSIGIAPRIVASPSSARTQFSAGASAAIASTTSNSNEQSYWMFGIAVIAEHKLLSKLLIDAEVGLNQVIMMEKTSGAGEQRATPYRIALGIQYRL